MGRGDTLLNAVIGALVTVVLSFTGFSPVIGGGVAGYLQRTSRRDGARVGGISGVIAAIPLALGLLVFSGFLFGVALPGMGTGPGPAVPGAFGALAIVFALGSLLWTVALSAVGGYLGVYVATETSVGS